MTTFNTLRGEKKAKLSSQPWADTNILTSAVSETVRLIKQNVSIMMMRVFRILKVRLSGAQCAEEDAAIFGKQ